MPTLILFSIECTGQNSTCPKYIRYRNVCLCTDLVQQE